MFLLALLVIGGFAVYVMTPDERRRAIAVAVRRVKRMARGALADLDACAPWLAALRARSGRPVVALAIAAVYGTVAALMFGNHLSAGTDTLVTWGATVGPRTTNGEWWRLLTAVFLHRGVVSLAIDLMAIVQLGFVAELVFGRAAFASVFAVSGVLANVVHLAGHPVDVRTGASGALYGLYGLVIAWAIHGLRKPSELTIPLPACRLLAPVACLFVFAGMVSDGGSLSANAAALALGAVSGWILVGMIEEGSPAPVRMAVVAGAAIVTIVLMAVPSIGTMDVRPEIARVIGLEAQTAAPYAKAVGQFRRGITSAAELADMIDGRILPEIRQEQERLDRLRRIPPEHRAIVDDARRYVRLRGESWELRARALHASNMRALRRADDKEREALDAFDQLKAESLR